MGVNYLPKWGIQKGETWFFALVALVRNVNITSKAAVYQVRSYNIFSSHITYQKYKYATDIKSHETTAIIYTRMTIY